MFNMIVRLGPAACLLAVAACASRYGDRPLDVSAPLRGNATVRAVVFQATLPSDPVAKPKTAAVAEVVAAAAAPARDRGKRKTTRAVEARPDRRRPEPRRSQCATSRPHCRASAALPVHRRTRRGWIPDPHVLPKPGPECL